METKEFRKGNYILDQFDRVAKIETIGFNDTVRLSTKTYSCESMKLEFCVPIPLTEEILLKCKGISRASLRPAYDHENTDRNYDEEYYSKSYDLMGTDLCGFSVFKCELENGNYQWIGLKDGKLYFVDEVSAADESMYLSKTSVGLSFLHEFQNAFPFFTGEELEVNL